MQLLTCMRIDDPAVLHTVTRAQPQMYQRKPILTDRWIPPAPAAIVTFAPPSACPPDCEPVAGPLRNFYRLANGIYRGGHPYSEASFRTLQKLGVRTILNLEDCTSTNARNREEERRHARLHGMAMVHAPISPIFSVRFKVVMEVVRILADPARRPVYVHCLFGHERTGFVIALNRFFNEGWSYQDAHAEMVKCGFRRWLTPMMYGCFRRWCEKNPHRRVPKED